VEEAAQAPDFWDNSQQGQETMQELASLREEVEGWQSLVHRAADISDLLELAVADEDENLISEIAAGAQALQAELEQREFLLCLSGSYDQRDAILAIHAGAGGTESQDWAQMLMRMYLRWAEGRNFKTQIYHLSPGEEAGIKSVTVSVAGPYAYGYLRSEGGVHRLVRLSPFDAAHRRHTSFALVEVMPDVLGEIDIQIAAHDLRVDTYRSSGPGGQHMQKSSTAVRITHIPSGMVVTCENERSQTQNRATAMRILRARLLDLEQRNREEEQARLKGEHVEAGWGNQIRSYILHPYRMVKDLRTGYQVGNADAVLDGDLDEFMEAYLRSQDFSGNRAEIGSR
jgi:peptide chain release factor 2